jgi:hypothetical protein
MNLYLNNVKVGVAYFKLPLTCTTTPHPKNLADEWGCNPNHTFQSSYTHSNRFQVQKLGPYGLITSPSHTVGTARFEKGVQMPYLM